MEFPQVLPLGILYRAAFGALITVIGALILWPFKAVRKEWKATKETLAETKAELELQRTNHLTHIEEHGKTQIEILGKIGETLDGVRLDLREQTGYLAASTPRPRVRTKK